jgi:hypothetical protein
MTESVVDLVFHQRRVGLVIWHPSAQNILLSAGTSISSPPHLILFAQVFGSILVFFSLPRTLIPDCYHFTWQRVGSSYRISPKNMGSVPRYTR